jgi:hypothetical protein
MIKHRKAAIYRSKNKPESFNSLISFHHASLNDKIRALRVINELSSKVLDDHLQSINGEIDRRIAKLPRKARSEYDEAEIEMLAPASESIRLHDIDIEHPSVAKIIQDKTEMYNHREHIRRSSKEMILVYLITIFEEFLANLLTTLLRKRPEILEPSYKSIIHQQAFQYVDLHELLKTSSSNEEEEARSIMDLDIDKLGNYLYTKFKFNLNQHTDWDQFKEFFYRRHVVIHNYGYPDSIYIAKVKYKVNEDEWLEIDNTYLEKAFDIFEKYSNKIALFFDRKYS